MGRNRMILVFNHDPVNCFSVLLELIYIQFVDYKQHDHKATCQANRKTQYIDHRYRFIPEKTSEIKNQIGKNHFLKIKIKHPLLIR
jgi:hypothetical protein